MKRRGFDKEKQADLSGLVKIAGGPNGGFSRLFSRLGTFQMSFG
jgi:hypothetical protein